MEPGTFQDMRSHIVAVAVLSLSVTTPVTAEAVRTDPAGWPLQPRPKVVRGFEPPPKHWLPGHRGVDLLGVPGQTVLAPAAGTVTYAGALAGRGVVVLSHGATRTTYQPVRATVRAGAVVPAGAPLGRLSAAGSHCAPRACLHWGLLRGTEYLDPLSLIGATPVRLLPLIGDRASGPLRHDRSVPDRSDPGAAARGRFEPRRASMDDPIEERAGAAPRDPESAARASPARDLPSYLLVGLAALLTVTAGVMVARH